MRRPSPAVVDSALLKERCFEAGRRQRERTLRVGQGAKVAQGEPRAEGGQHPVVQPPRPGQRLLEMGGRLAELAPLHRHHPETDPTERDACRIAMRPRHGQALVEARLGPRSIALGHGQ